MLVLLPAHGQQQLSSCSGALDCSGLATCGSCGSCTPSRGPASTAGSSCWAASPLLPWITVINNVLATSYIYIPDRPCYPESTKPHHSHVAKVVDIWSHPASIAPGKYDNKEIILVIYMYNEDEMKYRPFLRDVMSLPRTHKLAVMVYSCNVWKHI